MTYFLVGSMSQYDFVMAEQTAIAETKASKGEEHWFSVLLADTPFWATDAWDQIEQAKAEWRRCCATAPLQVVDLRHPEVIDMRQLASDTNLLSQYSPIVIYLAESEAIAASALASAESDRNESEKPRPVFFAFKVTTPEEKADLAAFVATWEGHEVHLLDSRNSSPVAID
jgi:hypothetical protein